MYRVLPKMKVTIAVITVLLVNTAWADVPAPPVNQSIGLDDVTLGDLEEADCRVCHDSGVPDRHHMLYDQLIPEVSLVPYPDTDGDGNPDTNYSCLSCHGEDFTLERDCTVCHDGESPHHMTQSALDRDCVACHGDLVDNFDDGHYIPNYDPSLVTPARGLGDDGDPPGGLPLNSRGNPAGACNYCHDDDGLDPQVILTNRALHHGTGLLSVEGACTWCHDFAADFSLQIRVCEQCHGPDSLHNIQADSPNQNNIGTIVVGGEDAGYGHVGRDAGPGDSDCWGCHGFPAAAEAPQSGPIIPSIGGSNTKLTKAGTDTPVVVGGSGFTNLAGNRLFQSDVRLTAEDGSTVTLKPDTMLADLLTVTIPGATAPGNYKVQAVKAQLASNPAVISIVPTVVITAAISDGRTVTISGSGFAGFAPGSGTSVTAKGTTTEGTTMEGTIVSWSATTIVAEFASSPAEVTVTSVFGAATAEVARGSPWTFRRGDSNADGDVDLSDAIHTLAYLFVGGRTLSCPDAGDSDDSGKLDVTDAIVTLNWLFASGRALAFPGPDVCGPDATEDALPACNYDPAGC